MHIAQQMVQKDIKSQQLALCTVTEESTVCSPSMCVELVTEDMPFEPVNAEIGKLYEEEEICLSVSDEKEQLEQSESDGYLSSNGTISDDVSSLSDPDDHYLATGCQRPQYKGHCTTRKRSFISWCIIVS